MSTVPFFFLWQHTHASCIEALPSAKRQNKHFHCCSFNITLVVWNTNHQAVGRLELYSISKGSSIWAITVLLGKHNRDTVTKKRIEKSSSWSVKEFRLNSNYKSAQDYWHSLWNTTIASLYGKIGPSTFSSEIHPNQVVLSIFNSLKLENKLWNLII